LVLRVAEKAPSRSRLLNPITCNISPRETCCALKLPTKTPLGVEAKKYIDQGLLVPDEVVIGMISSCIDESPEARGFIFDGFPRTEAQAESLDKLLEFKQTQIHLVLSLEVPETELIRRLLGRGVTSGRSDDTEEVIAKRIKEYYLKTEPVAGYYAQQGKVERIKGDHDEKETFRLLQKQIDKYLMPA
jgi:adenylate kinase